MEDQYPRKRDLNEEDTKDHQNHQNHEEYENSNVYYFF